MRVVYSGDKSEYLCGKRILPSPIKKEDSVSDIIENSMLAYNSGRLREAVQLLKQKILKEEVTVGMSLAGALTPAGLGVSSIIPLINHGAIDWISSTGANMYHDIHFAFNMSLHAGSPNINDCKLREHGVVRIYDILLDYDNVLMKTDSMLRKILTRKEFQKEMGTQEFYYHLGKIMDEYEKQNKIGEVSILAAAYRNAIPIFTSSPGDSTIGMNIAGLEILDKEKFKLRINPSIDIIESTAIVLNAKLSGRKTGVILVGGGSPKNFMLQTEPEIQEVLMIPEVGQDYFIQITDARPDTGGLSGATPREAVSWGKIDPESVSDSVVIYNDATIILPLLTSFILNNIPERAKKRLYEKREALVKQLREEYFKHNDEIEILKELLEKNQ